VTAVVASFVAAVWPGIFKEATARMFPVLVERILLLAPGNECIVTFRPLNKFWVRFFFSCHRIIALLTVLHCSIQFL